jgi:hypothetical protein
MRVCFTSNTGEPRWAWTEGMRESEPQQAELGVPVPWLPEERRDAQIESLFTFLHRYVARHGKPIRADQTLRYGWTLLRVEAGAPELVAGEELLRLQELADPFARDATDFIDGVTSAVALLDIQTDAIVRNRITGTAEHPHRDDSILVCSRVDPAGGTPLSLTRQSLTNRRVHDSGWFAGCQARSHDHDDPEQLHSVHLAHLVARYPGMFPYLGMPIGTRVALDGDRLIVFPPEQRRGHEDDAPPFTLPFVAI